MNNNAFNLKSSGYTLIEVLIALTVFAIMASITATVIYQTFDTRERIDRAANEISKIQLTVLRIEHDTHQFVNRAIRGKSMEQIPAFIGQHKYLEFSGIRIHNRSEKTSSPIYRVAYLCKSDSLIRRSWQVMDTPNRDHYEDLVLLNKLNDCRFNFISQYNQALPDWRVFKINEKQKISTIPRAIKLSIESQQFKQLSFLFTLSEGLYAS